MSTQLERAFEFAQNMYGRSQHISNIYVAELYDKDGNKKSEHYGINVMTDLGFVNMYRNNTTFPSNLYVGEGNNASYDKSNNTMISLLFGGLAASNINTTAVYNLPMFYARGEHDNDGVIALFFQKQISRYSYNIASQTSAVRITEYGIGSNATNLWTHSFVYDIQGRRAAIIKEINDQLDITVYLCCSFYESLIMNNYANNTFIAMTGCQFMMNRFKPSKVYTYKSNLVKTERPFDTAVSTVIDSKITNTFTAQQVVLTNDLTDAQGYIDGWLMLYDNLQIIQPQQLTTPESITLDGFFAKDYRTEDAFASSFGVSGGINISHFAPSTVYGYNTSTNDYDLPLTFEGDDARVYDETMMSKGYNIPLYYTNNSTVERLYLYQNTSDDPIVGFNNNIETLYATDKYWVSPNIEGSDWTLVTNRAQIPSELQNKRYWITNVDENLNPIRASKTFKILPDGVTSGYHTYPGFTSTIKLGTLRLYYNTEYEIFTEGERLFCPATGLGYTIENSSLSFHGYGKWIMSVYNPTGGATVRFVDISNIKNGVAPVTITDNLPGSQTKAYAALSDSETGIIVFQFNNNSNWCYYDLRSESVVQPSGILKNGKCAAAIWGTQKICYINTTTSELEVFDVDSDAVVNTYTLPSDISNVVYMCGHTNYVWLTNNSSVTYKLNLTTGAFTVCSTTMTFTQNNNTNYNIQITAVSNMIVIFNNDKISSRDAKAYAINVTNDTTASDIVNIAQFISYENSDPGFIDYHFITSRNNQIGLYAITHYASNSISRAVLDYINLYKYFYDRTIVTNHWYISENSVLGIYGNDIFYNNIQIPIEFLMPIKATGTTKTISAYNGQKALTNKQWSVEFTNAPLFNGPPPGKQN